MWENTYKNIYPQKKLDEYNINLNEIKFKTFIKNTQKLYVVLNDKKIIGYISFDEILRTFENYTHDIGLLYLLKEYQGIGLGKKLFNFAKN
ncbi:MAG: GNAT family N-acetyltransferase [Peptostreptococcaceae bacterium]